MRQVTSWMFLVFGLTACTDPTRPMDPPSTLAPADVAAAATTVRFTARNLGTLGGDYSFGEGINERSQVGGSAQLASGRFRAFFWSAGEGMRNLGTLGGPSFGIDINDLGDVIGFSEIPPGDNDHGFLWTRSGGLTDLGGLGGVGTQARAVNNSQAFDINDASQVVGSSQTSSGEEHAFLWSPARGMEDLGTLGGTFSFAAGISQAGDVVGFSEVTPGSGIFVAFLWRRGRGMRNLGTLGGDNSNATSVNTHLEVAGVADATTPQTTFPFIWTPKGGMRRLPTLGGKQGGDFGVASRINAFGNLTGYTTTARGVLHATLWTPTPGPLLAPAPDEPSEVGTAATTAVSAAARATLCAAAARGASHASRYRTILEQACLAR